MFCKSVWRPGFALPGPAGRAYITPSDTLAGLREKGGEGRAWKGQGRKGWKTKGRERRKGNGRGEEGWERRTRFLCLRFSSYARVTFVVQAEQ